ncbi:hypothetical protein HDU87_001007 [Geranomyces variabilis]|uniref:HNH nuclease domain-containing protein n=1 Tax=Geranomyces variabilis TaxID=109894 RepID=A0AAD5XIC5_9FUNG|nr:hypothetical protein HDU87_001007 [Geranomyces variabilis]
MTVPPFLEQFVDDCSHDPALAALPPADPADPAAAHVRLCLSLFLGAQRMFAIHTPLRDTLATLSTNCFDDPTYIADRLHDLYADVDREVQRFQKVVGATPVSTPQPSPSATPTSSPFRSPRLSASIFPSYPFSHMTSRAPDDTRESFAEKIWTRDQHRCKVTGTLDLHYVAEHNLDILDDEAEGFLEAAHVFPFGLRYHVPYLSSMVYPCEFFMLLKQGEHINMVENGLLLEDDGYEVIQWGQGQRPSYAQVLTFEAQPPSPLLINLHGCFAVTCAAWVAVKKWKAEGERDLWLLDDDDEEQTVARVDCNQTLGEAVSASFASKHTPFVEDEPELLSLGEPAVF